MIRSFRKPLLAGSLVCLATSLASCGPDDGQVGTADHYSLGPTAPWVDAFPDSALAEPPLPDAVPMLASGPARYSTYRSALRTAPASGYDDDYREYGPDYGPDYGDVPPDAYEDNPGIDSYGLLALASTVGGILGSAPPDYAFGYGDAQPWAWQTGDRWVRYAEPVDDGYRYYYYEPDSVRPFLVRDPYYSYGYRDNRLVSIYDRSGRVIDPRRAYHQRRVALRYAERGYDLYRTGRHARRVGVDARAWQQQREPIWRAQQRWDQARATRREWRDWDSRHQQALAARWTQERLVRERAATRFAQWQRADYRGAPPRFYQEAAADRKLRQQVRQAQMEALAGRRDAQQARAIAQRRAVQADARRDRLADIRDDRRAAQMRQAAQRQTLQQRAQVQRARQEQVARLQPAQKARAERADLQQAKAAQIKRARLAEQRQAQATRAQVVREQARRDRTAQARVAQQRARNEQAAQARVAQQRARNEQAAQARVAQQRARNEQAAQARVAQQRARNEQAAQARAAQQQARREQVVQARAAQQQARREQARASQQQARRDQAVQARAAQQQARREQAVTARAVQQQAHREQVAHVRAARQHASPAPQARREAVMKRLARDN